MPRLPRKMFPRSGADCFIEHHNCGHRHAAEQRASGRNFGRTSSGFGVGLLDVLEVGFVPIRVGSQLSPETGDTEIDFLDPWFYLAAAPLRTEHVHLGLSYGLFIPLQASTVLTQQPSIDLLVRSRYLRGDVSLYTRFDTPIRPSPFETGEQSTYVTPGFDVALVGQPLAGLGLLLGFRNELFDLEDQVADLTGQASPVPQASGKLRQRVLRAVPQGPGLGQKQIRAQIPDLGDPAYAQGSQADDRDTGLAQVVL